MRLCLLFFLFLTAAALARAAEPAGEEDPDMAAAVAQARETLPRFLEMMAGASPAPPEAKLRVALSSAAAAGGAEAPPQEQVWITGFYLAPQGGFAGMIESAPAQLAPLGAGSTVEFEESAITDWCLQKAGRIYGCYTTRVQLQRTLSAEEVARIRHLFADDPYPPEWIEGQRPQGPGRP